MVSLISGNCHSPEKKKEEKEKSPPGPPVSLSLSLLSVLLGATPRARVAVAGVQPRASRHVPFIFTFRAAASFFSPPFLIRARPVTIPANPSPVPHLHCRRPSYLATPIRHLR